MEIGQVKITAKPSNNTHPHKNAVLAATGHIDHCHHIMARAEWNGGRDAEVRRTHHAYPEEEPKETDRITLLKICLLGSRQTPYGNDA